MKLEKAQQNSTIDHKWNPINVQTRKHRTHLKQSPSDVLFSLTKIFIVSIFQSSTSLFNGKEHIFKTWLQQKSLPE